MPCNLRHRRRALGGLRNLSHTGHWVPLSAFDDQGSLLRSSFQRRARRRDMPHPEAQKVWSQGVRHTRLAGFTCRCVRNGQRSELCLNAAQPLLQIALARPRTWVQWQETEGFDDE